MLYLSFTYTHTNKGGLTLVDGLGHGDADAQTVGSFGAVGGGQLLTVGQLQPLEDHGVGAGDDVLGLAQVVLQDLALVLAQVARLVAARGAVAGGEGEVAEGRDGELGAAVGQVVGRADHGEGGWGRQVTRQLLHNSAVNVTSGSFLGSVFRR